MAICYWDWLLDYDDDDTDNDCPVISDNYSGIWDADAFGTQYTPDQKTHYVTSGVCSNSSGWVTVMPTGSNINYPTVAKYRPFDYKLKRSLSCDPNSPSTYSLNIGPSQAMQSIVGYSKYIDFEPWVEAGPHGLPHMFCGYTMGQMFSPDDPLFFLHHCNIDRLYHCWIDCHGYENLVSLKAGQYSNFLSPDTTYALSSEITYNWDGLVTEAMPKIGGKWPSPNQLFNTGLKTPGYDGINYRYGADNLVRSYGTACPDQTWSIVDPGYKPSKKRDESLHPRLHEMVDSFEGKLNEGKSHVVALHEMAMEECQSAPKNEITRQFKAWMDMMNVKPEQFDSICDKPSERQAWKNQVNEEEENVDGNRPETKESLYVNAVPLWGIIVASVGSAFLLIVVVSVVIVITMRRKSKAAENAGSYREM